MWNHPFIYIFWNNCWNIIILFFEKKENHARFLTCNESGFVFMETKLNVFQLHISILFHFFWFQFSKGDSKGRVANDAFEGRLSIYWQLFKNCPKQCLFCFDLFCSHEIHRTGMLQIVCSWCLWKSSWWGGVHGALLPWMFGLVVQKFLNIEWFLHCKNKVSRTWKLWRNWNVPLVVIGRKILMNRIWWNLFDKIWIQNVRDIDL
jgi:hypothetical protein